MIPYHKVMAANKLISVIQSPATNLRLLYVFSYAAWTAWIPFFGLFLKDEHMGGSRIGYISSLIWVIMLIIQPMWGIKADKSGKVPCYKASVLLSALLLLVFFFAGKSLLSIVLCTVGCSLAFIAVQPLQDTLALDYIDTNPGLSYGNLRFWGAVGAGVGAQVTGLVIEHLSSQYIFLTASIFLLCCIPFMWRLKEKQTKHSMRMEFKDIKPLLANKGLLSFLVVIVFVSLAQTSIWYYITIYLKDIGASDYMAGSALTVDSLGELPFYFLAAVLFRKIGIRRTILLAFLATAIRLFLYAVNDKPMAVLLIEASHGISWTLMWVASVEYVNRLVKPEWRTTGQSLLWAAYYGAGQILGNLWVGYLYERIPMQSVYAINGGIVVVFFVITLFLFRKIPNNVES